jgi:Fic family protein
VSSSIESRVARLQELERAASPDFLRDYRERLDISWVYHDSALEGVVYTMDELRAAILDHVVSDSSLIPVYDEIRHHKAAIDLVRELTEKRRLTINLEVVKRIYGALAPDEVEGKQPPKYRKDMPLHRTYFHEIVEPDKISYHMRPLVQWLNAADTKRSTHAVRMAAKAHFKMLHIYPFPKHSGKVARLLMNLILMRAGYPPVIIHATERQRYYESLKGTANNASRLITEALAARLSAVCSRACTVTTASTCAVASRSNRSRGADGSRASSSPTANASGATS